ncbi:hypothetical protein [Nostoc sp.]|uniref:hypothetical protein n=1 Tax=Nostoc sp. TaxID=1180 RepID=UPI002FF62108
MWIDFPSTSPSGGGEWLELGGVKGAVSNNILTDNPQGSAYINWKGHFFAYSFYDTTNGVHYHEGKVGSANPTGTHTYQIDRDFSASNQTRWRALVDGSVAYYLTTSSVTSDTSKYSSAVAISFGIESSDNTYTFTNGTTIDSVYTLPATTSTWTLYQGGTSSLDHDTYNGMASSWQPFDGVNNSASFTHN